MAQYYPQKRKVVKQNFVALIFKIKDRGKLEEITSQNVNKKIAVFVNNELVTTPVVREPISSGKVEIYGGTEQQATLLADKINKEISHINNQ